MSGSRELDERSKYLCPYCGTTLEAFDTLKAHVLTEHRGESVPAAEGLVGLTVNGQAYEVHVEPEWTLYDLIHDKMGLSGTKMFCDRGACGSCTVILDGRAVLSCMTLAIECAGKTIETVEGVAMARPLLIEKYAEHHTMQCGYCTPGFVVTAAALLDKNPEPTEDEIRQALAGNLCRCGTYPQHPKAISEAAPNPRRRG